MVCNFNMVNTITFSDNVNLYSKMDNLLDIYVQYNYCEHRINKTYKYIMCTLM